MNWPIPKLSMPKVKSVPNWRYWLFLFCLLVIVGLLIAFLAFDVDKILDLMIYGLIPSVLLWIVSLGFAFNRYMKSVKIAQSQQAAINATHRKWEKWSQKQLVIIGNIIFSPEKNAAQPFLGELKKIPAYPKKARGMYTPMGQTKQGLQNYFLSIDQSLEQQSPGYRHSLDTIYLAILPGLNVNEIRSMVYEQWGLVPEKQISIENITSFYENLPSGYFLILTIQTWPIANPKKHSEFIAGTLFSGSAPANKKVMKKAGVSRPLIFNKGHISEQLDTLFEYQCVDKKNVKHLWCSSINSSMMNELAIYISKHSLPLLHVAQPHLIDHVYGPPSELMHYINISLAVEAVQLTQSNQILIQRISKEDYAIFNVTT